MYSTNRHPTETNSSPDQRANLQWLLILVLAVSLTFILTSRDTATAQAQQSLAGGRGVFAFTGQIDRDTFGLFMIDVDTETIWCYEMSEGRRGTRELKLIAGRSYEFDRYLKNFNTASPSYRDVRDLLELERKTTREAGRWSDLPSAASESRGSESTESSDPTTGNVGNEE